MSIRSALESRDLHDEAFARDPFPVWQRLRDEAPLFHDTVDDVYLLTRYEDVTAVLRDDVTYSTWIYKSWFATVMGETFAQYDGERHARERARVAPHLVGAPLDRLLRPAVTAAAEAVVAALPAGERRPDRTVHIPVARARDGRALHDPGREQRAVPAARGSDLVGARRGRARARGRGRRPPELEEWTASRIEERLQAGAPDDLLQWLARADADGHGARAATTSSPTSTSSRPPAARPSTTRCATCCGRCSLTLSRRRGRRGRRRCVDRIVTETFRYAPPVPYEGRIMTADVEWHGRLVPKGSIVRVALASATNDETVFEEPRRFDPARAGPLAGRLAWGRPARRCGEPSRVRARQATSAPATSSRGSRPTKGSSDSSATGGLCSPSRCRHCACTSST